MTSGEPQPPKLWRQTFNTDPNIYSPKPNPAEQTPRLNIIIQQLFQHRLPRHSVTNAGKWTHPSPQCQPCHQRLQHAFNTDNRILSPNPNPAEQCLRTDIVIQHMSLRIINYSPQIQSSRTMPWSRHRHPTTISALASTPLRHQCWPVNALIIAM